ncbi:MAG: metallophosphoesterase [Candidatus Odinarchaeia archaeon]
MKIGLISDTHDNIYAVRDAVNIFNSREVSEVLHAGDIISPFVIKEFKELLSPITFILGNNEGEITHLKQMIEKYNFTLSGRFYQKNIGGKQVAMVHGHIPIVESLIRSKMFDIVISGHTHRRLIERKNETLHVNPGEACGYLTGTKTIAILDIDKLSVDFIEL